VSEANERIFENIFKDSYLITASSRFDTFAKIFFE